MLLAKGLPVKDAALMAQFGLALRLVERERTSAVGGAFPVNFFCIPLSALHDMHASTGVWQVKVT